MKWIAFALLVCAGAASASNLDGKWVAEITPAVKKAPAGKKGGGAKGVLNLDFKAQDSQLTGSVMASHGKHGRPSDIQDGKIEGDHFTFTTVEHRKKTDVKLTWQGTVNGEQISGTRSRDGSKRGVPFTAKRQG